MTGPTYTIYHARDWAEGKTPAEIRAELAQVEHKALHHNFQWNEVGNRSDTWTRFDTLAEILKEHGLTVEAPSLITLQDRGMVS